jgi:hypothetical protein
MNWNPLLYYDTFNLSVLRCRKLLYSGVEYYCTPMSSTTVLQCRVLSYYSVGYYRTPALPHGHSDSELIFI